MIEKFGELASKCASKRGVCPNGWVRVIAETAGVSAEPLVSLPYTWKNLMTRLMSVLAAGLVLMASSAVTRADDVVDTAIKAKSFQTLVKAVKAGGLVEALKGDGPFTVFAPTDAAFKKLPAGTVETLLRPENKEKLVAILKYHVVSGKVMAADVVKLSEAKTLAGQAVTIDATNGVKINQSNVVKADIVCDNGVIHVIDQVLLPPAK